MNKWSRREFLIAGAAASAASAKGLHADARQALATRMPWQEGSAERAAAIVPLLNSNAGRPLRYTPEDGDFVIRNGRQFFNRPIYGPNNSFRVDAGDLPEFSLYLPGHGGNLKFGVTDGSQSKWLHQVDDIVARYRPGRMLYQVHDSMLGTGVLELELLTEGVGSGLMVRVQPENIPASVSLISAFGGVSGRKGKRGGDIGCEDEPVTLFFQLRPEECKGNRYTIDGSGVRLSSEAARLRLQFPSDCSWRVCDGRQWYQEPLALLETRETTMPVIVGSIPLDDGKVLYCSIARVAAGKIKPARHVETALRFSERGKQIAAIANAVRINTPDPFINASAGALTIAADALWQEDQGCLMHGDVAWRVPLVGWRGPYVLDAIGDHERMQQNILHWIARQNTSPVTTTGEATGPADPGTRLTRKEKLLHSSGDLSNNHYDMNLVFFDAFFRHLRWTGDREFARKVWPALTRHLAWERRLFRRTFQGKDGTELPLYEAYACIWASDNLQYNGGGATHSSAYNYFAHKEAAALGKWLGEDTGDYENEAQRILDATNELLWLSERGAYAEAKDILTEQKVYTSPAVWTMYHVIDQELADPRQRWQAAQERLASLRKVPVQGNQVPADSGYMLSCSDWMPYEWSLNLLVLAENSHTALAFWQAGMADEAFYLMKGNLMDSMYQGLCPGNFHMSSELDPHRHEAQRDFGDPIGITSRAIIEGLFGVRPDVWKGKLIVCPGFPSHWNHASLDHPDISIAWRCASQLSEFQEEEIHVESRFAKPVALELRLPARGTRLPQVLRDHEEVTCQFDPKAVGKPVLVIQLPHADAWAIRVRWRGKPPMSVPPRRSYELGEQLPLPDGVTRDKITDPQGSLNEGRIALPGPHMVFAEMEDGDCRWALPIAFTAKSGSSKSRPAADLSLKSWQHPEMIDLTPYLQHKVTNIFKRRYLGPRSPFCSLSLPVQGTGGWANFKTDPDIDDRGLRALGGVLKTPFGVPFRTVSGHDDPNCIFVSQWELDQPSVRIPLGGRAESVYLMMAGSTLPRASRMTNGIVTIAYTDGTKSLLELNNPETWWPIEQDYLVDEFMFVDHAPFPARVNLRTAEVRQLTKENFVGSGREVPGGAATILSMRLDAGKALHSLEIRSAIYGVVIGLMAVTLIRSS
jgi:hypothetical protein